MTRAGYIKAVSAGAFRTQGRGGRGVQGARLKEEDLVNEVIHTTAHAYLLLFSNRGKVYRLRAHEIPMKERTATGHRHRQPAAAGAQREDPGHHRRPATSRPTSYLVFATKLRARSRRRPSASTTSRAGRASSPSTCARATSWCGWSPRRGDDDIFMVTRNGHDHPLLRDRRAGHGPRRRRRARHPPARRATRWCRATSRATTPTSCIVTDAGYGKRTKLEHFNRQARGGQGVRGIRLTGQAGLGGGGLHGRPRRRDPAGLLRRAS